MISATGSLDRAQNPNRQNHGKYTGAPLNTSECRRLYPCDLTERRAVGQLEPVTVGMQISRMIQILSRKTKNNPVLVEKKQTNALH